ncbi:bidirectional sugar transporter SWEET16-like isoform X3 [Dendrobium catenatum]|uniref:bidirectional sugar transporter SWEET16-like isoform X3 n=1 Tax=Dendrobium catenatum TaxID=906689 RepID=UPI00109FC942|nr:bidirectional sugar transporter SWEET16-like isoform X3 [Dendrobium catenatum]
MADLSFIVGLVGNVISILVFASPIGTFRRVVKKKSTESFKWQPYVTTLMSTSLWTYYGLLKTNGLLVVTVNGAGTVLQAIYVILYLIYTSKDTRIYMAKMVGLLNVGVIGVVILVTHLALHGSLRLLVMGSLCAALTIGMYASPLYAMKMVMKTKSVEYMPFSLSFFLFLNAGIWSIYSVLVRDIFILPNAKPTLIVRKLLRSKAKTRAILSTRTVLHQYWYRTVHKWFFFFSAGDELLHFELLLYFGVENEMP